MMDHHLVTLYDMQFYANFWEVPDIMEALTKLPDSGQRTEFETGAVRDLSVGKGRMDLLPWLAIIEVAKHCEKGAIKYGERNVDKGIPVHSFYDSAARHLAKHISGCTDEDHLVAACWNLLWALQQRFTHPELDDMPKSTPKTEKGEH